MFSINSITKKLLLHKHKSFDEYIEEIKSKCKELEEELDEFSLEDYRYSYEDAKEELGLDSELIDSLLDDYVKQILNTTPKFRYIIKKLQHDAKSGEKIDFTQFRDLTHKNLGVARNLRIKDAQKILSQMMKSDNLNTILKYISLLEMCAVLLKPKIAYEIYTS
jgi:chemotaxis methyl-accepting protein methylase